MALRDDLVANGWSQGRLIRAQDNAALAPILGGLDLQNGLRLMVITQVCDLLHHSIDAEPIAEVLIINVVPGKPDGNFVNCRSTRQLHLPLVTADNSVMHLRARRVDAQSIPRAGLQNLVPDADLALNRKSLAILQRWLALRYMRAALPDNFESRAAAARNEIRAALKQVPHDIDALYIALSSYDELPEAENYRIALFGVMRTDNYAQVAQKTKATEALEALAKILEDCEGIEVTDYGIYSADSMTLDDVQDLVLWNFDDLSLGADPQAAPPAKPAG